MATNEISVERLLEQDNPELVRYHKDIVMLSNFGDMSLLAHPVRLKGTIVLVCLKGVIDCNINLRRFLISENQVLVNLAGDIIQINKAENIEGYAIIISESYIQNIELDSRFRAQSYMNLRDRGPVSVPYDELTYLKPYYILMKKNMEEGNDEIIKGLSIALSHTITSLLYKYTAVTNYESDGDKPRTEQLFNKFMRLLRAYHTKERTLQFYADKMCLTPKYVSGAIKTFSGKGALDWINEYVVLEAKIMLRYTEMSVQEIAYALNFPTQSAFGKYFKQQSGMSPKHYRNKL